MAQFFLIALLFSSFSISIVGQDVADSAPKIFACRHFEYATSSRLTLMPEVVDPAGRRLTFQWTQVSGPPVTMRSNYHVLNFITPPEDSRVVLRLTASNGLSSSSCEFTIDAVSFPTHMAKLGVEVGLDGECHTSNLRVARTSLRNDLIWGRTDTELEIYLTASDGAVLVDTVDPFEPFGIILMHATGAEEITDMFSYSPEDNKVSLLPSRVADFRAQLNDYPVELYINGGDSVGNGACIVVPVLHAHFQIRGTVSTTSGSLTGTLVTIGGMTWDFTAVAPVGPQGQFHFDNIPGDTYSIDIGNAGELLGTGFCGLEGKKGNTFTSSTHIIPPAVAPIQCQPETSGAANSRP